MKRLLTILAAAALAVAPAVVGLVGNPSFADRSPVTSPAVSSVPGATVEPDAAVTPGTRPPRVTTNARGDR